MMSATIAMNGRPPRKGRSRRKQRHRQVGPTGHANGEREDGYDDEHHERARVHQLGRTSPSD